MVIMAVPRSQAVHEYALYTSSTFGEVYYVAYLHIQASPRRRISIVYEAHCCLL